MKTLSYDELSVKNFYIKFIINQAKVFQRKRMRSNHKFTSIVYMYKFEEHSCVFNTCILLI